MIATPVPPGPSVQPTAVDRSDGPRLDGDALPATTTRAAAEALDLSRSRQFVYIGGNGEVLAAFLEAWQQLTGVWLGPADAQMAARRFLRQHGLDRRMRYVVADTLEGIERVDLVVLSAVDAAVSDSLRLLVSAGPDWLPAKGRWLILRRDSPHLSSVIGPSLLQGQGMRVASCWILSTDVQMLVGAPAHRFMESLRTCDGQPETRDLPA